MNTEDKIKLEDFREAKKVALKVPENEMKLVKRNGRITNFYGANFNGRTFVVGYSLDDINNPDAFINGLPAKEVFGDFTVMYSK